MRVLQINGSCNYGSTGKICYAVSQLLNEHGIDNEICFSSLDSNYSQSFKFCSRTLQIFNAMVSRIFGNFGFEDYFATKRLIDYIEAYSPDIIHIHNIHSHDVNIRMLFSYLSKHKEIKVYYTFHDCWAFTGYCYYFTAIGCEKWRYQCNRCPQYKKFSWLVDRSKDLFCEKEKIFKSIDLHIITPSKWLGDLIKQSFLSDCAVHVINNGINLEIFKPTKSIFRQDYGIGVNTKIVLGVSFEWGYRKGLDIFIELAERFKDENIKIVLVGIDDSINVKIPDTIIKIQRTKNQHDLAAIYSAADVFINPTREDNYPTVNMEAIACGTPVITFNTGGSIEVINKNTGVIVNDNTVDDIEIAIRNMPLKDEAISDLCRKEAMAFDEKATYKKYIDLYLSMVAL